MKQKAILVGPFIGALNWEFFSFAPYANYLKNKNPNVKFLVLTRETSFDLYGNYADVLLPLRLKGDDSAKRNCFKIDEFPPENYDIIVKYFKEKYAKNYKIIDHIYPQIKLWSYKVRWQFPRDKMMYDFKPRRKNLEVANEMIGSDNVCLIDSVNDTQTIPNCSNISKIYNIASEIDSVDVSAIGIIIEAIRLCKYVAGDIRDNVSHLALLMGKPVINTGECLNDDRLHLINPLNTPVICTNNIEEGIEYYENNL